MTPGLARRLCRLPVARTAAFALAFAGSLFAASTAAAASKDECVDANTAAQSLRREGKLGAAREKLRLCVDPTCPALVRGDCTQRLDELDRAQPTIVFEAKDGDDHDLVAVKVTVDGRPLADRLDGSPLAVDPREHVFVFDSAGKPSVTRTFVLHEAEKGRREKIVLGPPSVASVASLPPAPAPVPPLAGAPVESSPPLASSTGSGQRVAGIVVGVAGLAAVTVGAIFGANADASASRARTECASATSCADHAAAVSDHDSAASAATISTIGFIAGGALVAGGVVLYLTSPRAPTSGSALVLTPTFGATSGGLLLRTTF